MDLLKKTDKLISSKRVDTQELELPETLYVSDIDSKVFQGIVLQCLNKIEGISLTEGGFISSILGRKGPEASASSIQSQQDTKNHSVSIKLEVNITYGLSIPAKAEEIQSKVVEEITAFTGLRVSSVHVIFKNIILPEQNKKNEEPIDNCQTKEEKLEEYREEEEF